MRRCACLFGGHSYRFPACQLYSRLAVIMMLNVLQRNCVVPAWSITLAQGCTYTTLIVFWSRYGCRHTRAYSKTSSERSNVCTKHSKWHQLATKIPMPCVHKTYTQSTINYINGQLRFHRPAFTEHRILEVNKAPIAQSLYSTNSSFGFLRMYARGRTTKTNAINR